MTADAMTIMGVAMICTVICWTVQAVCAKHPEE